MRRGHLMDAAKPSKRPSRADPGPARLFVLLAGMLLALLGVLGFFYDAEFGTGSSLASDDLAGILQVNGWRNVIYLVTGLLALGIGPRAPRATALALGVGFLGFGLWGLAETDRGIGSILDALPLGDRDNALHLGIGILGMLAWLADGGPASLPKLRRAKGPNSGARAGRGARRRSPAGPRRGGASEPR
jgi:hypothetical protein